MSLKSKQRTAIMVVYFNRREKMANRKHSEMIIEWAKNDKLVVLAEYDGEWNSVVGSPTWLAARKYFLCLPNHKDAVLELLSGGKAECQALGDTNWYGCNLGNPVEWKAGFWYMSDEYESRIRPKKQTRYAYAFSPEGAVTVHYGSIEELQEKIPRS